LHQVGDLFELNVKPRCQKVKVSKYFLDILHNDCKECLPNIVLTFMLKINRLIPIHIGNKRVLSQEMLSLTKSYYFEGNSSNTNLSLKENATEIEAFL
jgi:hypothetical protein